MTKEEIEKECRRIALEMTKLSIEVMKEARCGHADVLVRVSNTMGLLTVQLDIGTQMPSSELGGLLDPLIDSLEAPSAETFDSLKNGGGSRPQNVGPIDHVDIDLELNKILKKDKPQDA